MTDFQRTRSKVWFPSLDDDDEDIHHHRHSWRRQPSSSPESRRVSSGSPSNGSHRSQDSGFSDSESGSPPSSGRAPSDDPKATKSNDSEFANHVADGVLSEASVTCRILSTSPSQCSEPQIPLEPCDCFLPACELSRKFHSYECVSPAAETTVSPRFIPIPKIMSYTPVSRPEDPYTPNRTCFIVDELPKSGTAIREKQLQSTPSSVKSFDGNFDRSENVTVVENFVEEPKENASNNDDDNLIIDPPTPFVDRCFTQSNDDVDAASLHVESDEPDMIPEHTSTPKSSKNRCCTPRLHYRKELQLKKPKTTSDRYILYSYLRYSRY